MSPRAPKTCAAPGCTRTQPCPTHKPTPWAGSSYRTNRTSGWDRQQRAARILTRHNSICHVCGQPGANQADHVIPLAHGGADTEHNMRPIHAEPCHRTKTAQEARTPPGG